MRPVLFIPREEPGNGAIGAMIKAVARGLQCPPRHLEDLPQLGEDEIAVVSAVYTGSNRRWLHDLRTSGRKFIFLDHAPLGHLRNRFFRVIAGDVQVTQLVRLTPDIGRYRALGLPPVAPWHTTPQGKILVIPHTERFGEIYGFSPTEFVEWVRSTLPGSVNWEEDVEIRMRKQADGSPHPLDATQHMLQSRCVIGFNSVMLVDALGLGIPAIGHPLASILPAFNGLTPANVDNEALLKAKSAEERENLYATLATYYMASVEELATPGYLLQMAEIQWAG